MPDNFIQHGRLLVFDTIIVEKIDYTVFGNLIDSSNAYIFNFSIAKKLESFVFPDIEHLLHFFDRYYICILLECIMIC